MGIAGAVTGGALGAATAYAMKDEKTRKKVGDVLNEVKTFAVDSANEAQQTAQRTASEVASQTQKTISKNLDKKKS